MKYDFTFETRLEDANTNYEITNKTLLTLMENCAERHSSSLGFGLKDVNDTGITWVVVDWKLQVNKRPKYGDTLKVYTWLRNIDKFFSYRDFEVELNGEVIAVATSKWVLLNAKTKEVTSVTEAYKDPSKLNTEDKVFEIEPERLNLLESYDTKIPIIMRKSDMDLNGHVHNLNYIDFVNETMKESNEYNNVRIIYKKEVTFNDDIIVKNSVIDNKYYFLITDKNDTVYSIIEYK